MLQKESKKYREYVRSLPPYLSAFAEPQNYDQYTPEDQAVWRFIMRQLTDFFKDKAPEAYFKGLEKAQIPVDRIPKIEEMIEGLQSIGWGAICVNGFIPPAAFMEYNANKVLPISADMRSLKHLLYTPAPDIVHEAAGHAPIVADPEYTDFLQKVGEYGAKALSNKYDKRVYEAIRKLSIVKEYPHSTDEQVKECEDELTAAIAEKKQHPLSEASLISRFHWWTVEYGLLKRDSGMHMYGAGLLSSLGESRNCLNDNVKKIKLTADCLKTDYDITREQPQLYYVESSKDLFPVLEEIANTMAFRVGGTESLLKAKECETKATVQYSSGLQVTGIVTKVEMDQNGEAIYLGTTGPTTLSYANRELEGHGEDYHKDGFGSPIGHLKGHEHALREMGYKELEQIGVKRGEMSRLEFQSGIVVQGKLQDIMSRHGENIMMTFHDCTVTGPNGEKFFEPEWGVYDMAVGGSIYSVWGGPADKNNYEFIEAKSDMRNLKVNWDDKKNKVFEVFQTLRDMRESDEYCGEAVQNCYQIMQENEPSNWLAKLEILELINANNGDQQLKEKIEKDLEELKSYSDEYRHLISLGLKIA